MELRTVIFYGKAGAGKGTQAGLLKKSLEEKDPAHKVLYIETGAAFRTFAEKDNFTARLVKKTLGEGGLLPEFLPVWVWTQFFIDNIEEEKHIILDGLARRPDEVPILLKALEFYKRPSIDVVLLDISDEEAQRRLKSRARSDDADTEVKRRLNWFNENVIPAIERWSTIPGVTVHTIDATSSVEEVHKAIRNALNFS